MTPQEVAELICDPYTNITISPYATANGIEWTCEIMQDKNSVVCVEFAATIEEAVTQAYDEFAQTFGTHCLQREAVKA